MPITISGVSEKKWPRYADASPIFIGDHIKVSVEGSNGDEFCGVVKTVSIYEIGASFIIAEEDGTGQYKSFTGIQCAAAAIKLVEPKYYNGTKLKPGDKYVEFARDHRSYCAISTTSYDLASIGDRSDLVPLELLRSSEGSLVGYLGLYYGGDNTRWRVVGFDGSKAPYVVKVQSEYDSNVTREVKAEWLSTKFHNTIADIRRDAKMGAYHYCHNFALYDRNNDYKSCKLEHLLMRIAEVEDGR